MKLYKFRRIPAYLSADIRRAYMSYIWSALGMGAALAVTYWARTPRQQSPFIFVASTEVLIAVSWGFGPGTLSAIIAIVGMRLLFDEPLYSLVVFVSISILISTVSERRKRGEERLSRQALIFGNLTDAIIVTDLERKILDINPAAETMFGYSRDELVGRSVELIQKGPEAAARGEVVNRALAEHGFWKDEVVFVRKDGTEGICESTVVGIRDARDKLIARAGINRDITQRKELEQKLAQAQKMEAVGRLAGGIAHDFNNLLTAILGYSELLLHRIDESNPSRAMVVEIEKAGKRAASLTTQLLAFSRRQILQPRLLDLNEVISESDQILRRAAGDDVKLVLALGTGPKRVSADRSQIEQVLVNLVVNARDAMPGGGTLTIETANVSFDPSSSAQSGNEAGDQLSGDFARLVVEDTGIGMDEATVSQIFEPFFTTKPIGKGMGLGLSTAYGIVKQSGGEMKVTSSPGHGARFEVFLPAAGLQTAPGVEHSSQPEAGSRKTILIIEDEAAVRRLVQDMLSHAGYAVLGVAGGQEAFALSRNFKGDIDLVISDVVMPAMSGPQIVEQLSKQRPGMRIMFMSGYTQDLIFPRGAIESEAHFILKPFTPDEFLQKVRAILSESSPDSQT